MSFRLREGHRVFVYSEYVDMRSGFQRLSFYVREKMKADLLEGDLYLFLGKTRKLLKAICYDGTGLLLLAKRLERGRFLKLDLLEDFVLNVEELDILLRGGLIRRSRFGKSALTSDSSSLSFPINETDRTRTEYRSG